jgi:hypothetical protein
MNPVEKKRKWQLFIVHKQEMCELPKKAEIFN